MATPLNTLKNWFKTGFKPTQAQFWAWLDSFRHKDEPVPVADIDGLQTLLDAKVDKKDLIQQKGVFDPGKEYVYNVDLAEYVSYLNEGSGDEFFRVERWFRLLADTVAGESPESTPAKWKHIGTVLGEIAIEDVVGLREELDDRMLKANDHYRGAFVSKSALEAAIPVGRDGDFARVDPGAAADVTDYIWDTSDNKWVQSSSGGTILTDAVPTLGSTNAVQSGGTKTELNRVEDIAKKFSQKFSFSGLSSFKQAYDRPISIASVIKAASITDLRAGKNGATPTTMAFPYTIAANDVITFAATYDQESDSYFTLTGSYTD